MCQAHITQYAYNINYMYDKSLEVDERKSAWIDRFL